MTKPVVKGNKKKVIESSPVASSSAYEKDSRLHGVMKGSKYQQKSQSSTPKSKIESTLEVLPAVRCTDGGNTVTYTNNIILLEEVFRNTNFVKFNPWCDRSLLKIGDAKTLNAKLLSIKDPHLCHICLEPTPDCVQHMRISHRMKMTKTGKGKNKGVTVQGNGEDDAKLERHNHLRKMQAVQLQAHASVEISHVLLLLETIYKSTPEEGLQIMMAFLQELGHFPISAQKVQDAKYAGFFEISEGAPPTIYGNSWLQFRTRQISLNDAQEELRKMKEACKVALEEVDGDECEQNMDSFEVLKVE